MPKLIHFSRDQSGEGYVDLAIVVLVIFVLMAMLLSVYPIFTVQQSLNNTVRHIARTAEITGNASIEIDTLLENISSVKPDSLIWSTTWKDPVAKTIQLKTPFTVTTKKLVPLQIIGPLFGEPLVIKIEVSASASGISEVYYK
jgi:Flp pilus assembly protein TadG